VATDGVERQEVGHDQLAGWAVEAGLMPRIFSISERIDQAVQFLRFAEFVTPDVRRDAA
jgi:hypothetical protein